MCIDPGGSTLSNLLMKYALVPTLPFAELNERV
jgi:hypothetical protein